MEVIMIWAIMCILVAIACISGCAFLQSRMVKLGEHLELSAWIVGLAEYVILGMFALIFIGVAASPLYYEFPAAGGDLYSIASDGTLEEQRFGTFEEGKTLAYLRDAGSNNWRQASQRLSSVSIVSVNPNVRRISYTTKARVTDARTFLSNKDNRDTSLDWKDKLNLVVTSKLEFCIYELNNAHSKDIAGFYNPRDVKQALRFQELVGGYLNECLLGSGISALVVDFDIS